MDQTQLEPFVAALRRLMGTMFQMNVETSPSLGIAGVPPVHPQADVRAGVSLSGGLEATVELAFPLTTAQRLVSLFTGLEVHEQSRDDVADAIGEMVNIVAGNAKPLLRVSAGSVRSAPPAVVFDDQATPVPHAVREGGCAVRCQCECGEFTLRLVPGAAGRGGAGASHPRTEAAHR